MAEEEKERNIDLEYGYEDEKNKSFLQKILDYVKQKESKSLGKIKDVA